MEKGTRSFMRNADMVVRLKGRWPIIAGSPRNFVYRPNSSNIHIPSDYYFVPWKDLDAFDIRAGRPRDPSLHWPILLGARAQRIGLGRSENTATPIISQYFTISYGAKAGVRWTFHRGRPRRTLFPPCYLYKYKGERRNT